MTTYSAGLAAITRPSTGVQRWVRNIGGSVRTVDNALRYKTPIRVRRLRAHLRFRSTRPSARIVAIAWWIRLFSKGLDVMAAGEVYNLMGQVLKPTTRRLTAVEEAEARRIFQASIPYEQVRIDEFSLLAWIGAIFRILQLGQFRHLGVVFAYTANFTRPIQCNVGNADMAWLIHELAHVSQMEQVGLQYYPEAIYAQFTEGYAFDHECLNTTAFCAFNREQQADIVREAYLCLCHGDDTYANYRLQVNDMRQGLV